MKVRGVGWSCAIAAVLTGCATHETVPDLSRTQAARIISAAPEFNRYARLVEVSRLNHPTDSLNFDTTGGFSFVYLNSPADTQPIQASVEFQYHEGNWYLNQFWYGCPHDCRTVYVYDGPQKHR